MLKKLFSIFLRLRYGKQEPSTTQDFENLGKVIYPEGGGTDTYHAASKYPFPGFLTREDLGKIARWKRLIPLAADFLQRQLKPYIPDNPDRYSKPVREIYRVFNLMIERHHHKDYYVGTTFRRIRDIVCVLLEKDDAYRFPFQDAFSHLDLSQIKMDDRELYWACNKPYDFGGIENKEVMEKIREDRLDFETQAEEDLEIKIQEGMGEMELEKQKIQEIGKTLVPDLNAVLEKHNLKPDFNNPAEKCVDIKVRIKLK